MTAAEPVLLRHDADFLRYTSARLISAFGSGVTYVALPVLVYRLTGSPLLTGAVTASEALPYVLFGLLAGALGDRGNRRTIMVAMDLVAAVVVGSIPIAAAFGAVTVAQALLVGAAAATAFVFFDAADFGALPTLVGRGRLSQANSVVWTAHNLTDVVVPSLTGVALGVFSPASLITVDALSFVISAALVSRIHRRMSELRDLAERPRLRTDIRAGLSFLWHKPTVRAVTIAGTVQSFAGGAFVGQLVVYADRVFHVTTGLRFGLFYAAWGVGSGISGIAFAQIERRIPALRLAISALPASTVMAVAVALAPSYWLAVVAVGFWGVVYMLVVMAAITYRQQVTPEPLLSRVNTTGRMLSWGLGSTAGAVVSGIVANATSVRTALLVAAGVLAVGALLSWPARRMTEDPA